MRAHSQQILRIWQGIYASIEAFSPARAFADAQVFHRRSTKQRMTYFVMAVPGCPERNEIRDAAEPIATIERNGESSAAPAKGRPPVWQPTSGRRAKEATLASVLAPAAD